MADDSLKEKYQREDIAHGLHGLTVPSVFNQSGCLFYDRGSGVRLWDMDGKEYIDGVSGGMCSNVGYGRQELADVAREQLVRLHHLPTFGGRTNIPDIELTNKLAELAPGKLQRFHLASSGSDVVEGALKIARFYWREKGLDKYKIISLDRSYHGTTFGALSVSGLPFWKSPNFEPLVPGFIHIGSPYCFRCPWDKSYPNCSTECAQALEGAIEQEGDDSVAAFMAEPLLGAGGGIVPPPEYWQKVMAICAKHNVLLIIDEVITGFGRTGKFWACQHWDLKPDIMTMSKGLCSGYLPVAGLAITNEVYEGITKHNNPIPQAHTFGGHATGSAVSLKNIEILIKENLAENAAKMGAYARERLNAFKEKCPYVGDVRGLGLFNAVELVPNKDINESFDAEKGKEVGMQVVTRCYERGVIIVSFGDNIVNFGPPLIITKDDLDIILDTMEWAIQGIQV